MMTKRLVLCAALCAGVGCGDDASVDEPGSDASMTDGAVGGAAGLIEFDRSDYTDVGMDPLDYADPAMWACRPDAVPNECDADLDSTVVLADGTFAQQPHVVAEEPAYDCFYVYPTVKLDGQGNMLDFADIEIVLDPLLSQAARFTQQCRVFAPLYRQLPLSTVGSLREGNDMSLGVQDVRDAFDHYMQAYNDGRDIVIIGHSQGALMLTTLVQETFDRDAALREQLISALIIGGSVQVAEGETTGGTFENLPACTAAGQRGCVVAYSSFAAEAPPGDGASFGGAEAGLQALCTNPSLLAGRDGLLDSYVSNGVGNPTFALDGELPAEVEGDWARYRDMFRGECMTREGSTYLEVSIAGAQDDVREPPPYRSALLESIGFGLHVVDYNLPMGDLLEAVRLSAEGN